MELSENRKEKLKIYAREYALSHDPLQAYVKAGYVSSIEEAKQSGNYKKPLQSKQVQKYIQSFQNSSIKISEDLHELKIKKSPPIKKYENDSELGIDLQQFLIDIIQNPKIYPKDRLTASEILLKYKNGYYSNKEHKQTINLGILVRDNL